MVQHMCAQHLRLTTVHQLCYPSLPTPTGKRGGELLPKLVRPGALRNDEQRRALRTQAGAHPTSRMWLTGATLSISDSLYQPPIGAVRTVQAY